MPYSPIEDYGVIGNLHTVALAGIDGSIDFCCLPRFDSPSVFARILDDQKGGFCKLAATYDSEHRQMYLPDSNVLVTRFLSPEGVSEVLDFMPVREGDGKLYGEDGCSHYIVRRARAVRGNVHMRFECRPAYDFARVAHRCEVTGAGAAFEAPGMQLGVLSRVPMREENGGAVCEFTLQPNETADFVLRFVETGVECRLLEPTIEPEAAQTSTVRFWRQWLARSQYKGRWREMVHRSALVLKLLTYQPTGAIVASPTTSLPEAIGAERNWDYRFTWVRDAAFTVYAFLRLGFTEEASSFMNWLYHRIHEEEQENGPLQVMYGVDGRHELPEFNLSHLDGYKGSRPVRIGNAARNQLQLDIYGELFDSVYLYDKYVSRVSWDEWLQLQRMMDWVASNWEQPDEGIWEVRGGRHHFVYSKLQCWVALDRGIRMARKRSLPLDTPRFMACRDRIYRAIMEQGWNEERQTFVQYFGADAVDAANLIMPLVLFLSPTDPRMKGTIDETMRRLASDSLVHRYEIGTGAWDGFTSTEGTFSMCTFWLVEALSRAGRLEEARFIFEKMLTYANHVGLYAEEIGPQGEALGNFPQAFTHLSLISAAFNLDRHLDKPR
jgi:GH15 family glucan-1,4-alpha-glucosidase